MLSTKMTFCLLFNSEIWLVSVSISLIIFIYEIIIIFLVSYINKNPGKFDNFTVVLMMVWIHKVIYRRILKVLSFNLLKFNRRNENINGHDLNSLINKGLSRNKAVFQLLSMERNKYKDSYQEDLNLLSDQKLDLIKISPNKNLTLKEIERRLEKFDSLEFDNSKLKLRVDELLIDNEELNQKVQNFNAKIDRKRSKMRLLKFRKMSIQENHADQYNILSQTIKDQNQKLQDLHSQLAIQKDILGQEFRRDIDIITSERDLLQKEIVELKQENLDREKLLKTQVKKEKKKLGFLNDGKNDVLIFELQENYRKLEERLSLISENDAKPQRKTSNITQVCSMCCGVINSSMVLFEDSYYCEACTYSNEFSFIREKTENSEL